jgi:hypothetical protein
VCDEEVVHDPPPAHRGALLPAQPNHPGCRDEKKLDGYVVYEHVLISQQHRKKLGQVLLISACACSGQDIRFWAA